MSNTKQKQVFLPSGKSIRAGINAFASRTAIASYLDKFDSAVSNLDILAKEEAQEETAAINARFARYAS